MKKKIPFKIDKYTTVMLDPCDTAGCKNPGNFSSALNKKTDKIMNYCESCTKKIRALQSLMKVYVIIENFPADGGHKITIIKGAEDNEQALTLYKEHTQRDNLPSWIEAEEVTEQVTEIFRYDNPNYEG